MTVAFSDFKYARPNREVVERRFHLTIEEFKLSSTAQEQEKKIKEINQIRNEVMSMGCICSIRHSIDTTDEFYKNELNFFHDFLPILKGYETNYYKALVASPFRSELEEQYGTQLFKLAEQKLKTYSDDVIEDLQQENHLTSQYVQLISSAKISFLGKKYTLSQLQPFIGHSDRDIRKEAVKMHTSFFVNINKNLTIFLISSLPSPYRNPCDSFSHTLTQQSLETQVFSQ